MPRPRQRAIKHRALAMCRCGCRCHADRQRHPQTSRNGDIKQSPRPAGSQADLASAAGPCEAARVTSASWIGVERHQIHLPLLRWTEPARCHHRVSIGPIQVGFSLPHESHCDSKAREIRLESEQEPPFGGTKRAPCLLCSRTRLRTIS